MKIKTVCEKTGLTDRTVRYYIEEGLINPQFTENYLGRKAFDFTDENISELNDIAILRSFDFSIEEIRGILKDPTSSPAIIKDAKERLAKNLLSSGFIDMISLSKDVSMVEIDVKNEWIGKNLIELNLRKKYGFNIVAIKKGDKVNVNVNPEQVIDEETTLIVIANTTKLGKLK